MTQTSHNEYENQKTSSTGDLNSNARTLHRSGTIFLVGKYAETQQFMHDQMQKRHTFQINLQNESKCL